MSVATSISTISYTGNNSTVTAYSVPFPFLANSDLVVVKKLTATGAETTLTLTTDYTVSGAGNAEGGAIVTVAAIPNTYTVTIFRNIEAVQPLSYIEADNFPAASHEQALDRLTFLSQQNGRKLDAAFKLSETDGSLARFAKVLSALVGIDADGTPKMFTGAMIQTLLNLPATVIDQPTKTFANAAQRTAATPDFLGQVGVQLDTATIYTGTSIAAGGWTAYDFTLASESVGTTQLAALAVTAAKIAADAVTTAKILDANVTAAKLASDSVTTTKILDANVTTAKIADGAVTQAKIASGAVVQTVQASYTSQQAVTSVIPDDDTIPTVSEGAQLISQSFTPQSATNKVLVKFHAPVVSCNSKHALFTVFRGSTCLGIATCSTYSVTAANASLCILDSPASTSAQTYSVRCGPGSSGTIGINGTTGSRLYGGVAAVTLTLQEIKV